MMVILLLLMMMRTMNWRVKPPESVPHSVHEVHPTEFICIQQVPWPGDDGGEGHCWWYAMMMMIFFLFRIKTWSMCLPFSRRLWWFYYPSQSCQHTHQNPWTLASMISHFPNLVLTRHSLTCFPESSWSSSAPSSNQVRMTMKTPPRRVILDNFADKFSGLSRPAGNTEAIGTSHWHCLQDYHDTMVVIMVTMVVVMLTMVVVVMTMRNKFTKLGRLGIQNRKCE